MIKYPRTAGVRLVASMIRFLRAVLISFLVLAPASGQIWDRTGNNLLSGQYFFRDVIYVADGFGDLSRALLVYGSITFDGRGSYTVSATALDSAVGVNQALNRTGTYSVSASGYGFFDHPVLTSGRLMVLAANGVIVGSGTETKLNELFVAAPLGSATATAFNGSYSMAYMNFPTGLSDNNYTALAQLNPNGQGTIGSVPVKAYVASGTAPIDLTEQGVRYSFSQGLGRIDFPVGAGLAIAGTHMMVISADGNFIFGGSIQAWDFFVGVRRAPGTVAFQGLYYTAGMNLGWTNADLGGDFDSYYGSLKAANGTILGHQRFFSARATTGQNYSYDDSYPTEAGPEFFNSRSMTDYIFGADGTLRIGLGRAPYLGISLAVRAPDVTGTGVFLNPTGVLNGASSAPFTAGIARGEVLTLYGENLADQFIVAPGVPFPQSLGGVEVKINQRPAPIYYVHPNQVAVVVPYATSEEIAQVQVFKNGIASNAVTAFVYGAGPGVFTNPSGGLGAPQVTHLNYTLVTEANPAAPGETLTVFLTGLGDVFPTVPDGAAGPVSPLSEAANVSVFFNELPATVLFAGLAPVYAGLHQINVTVPAEVGGGEAYLNIAVAGSYSSQVRLPIASETSRPAPVRRR